MPSTHQQWLALRLIPRLASHQALSLLNTHSLEALFSLPIEQLLSLGLSDKQCQFIANINWSEVEQIVDKAIQTGAELVCYNDSLYPERLKQIYNPPLVLFIKGNAELLASSQIAMVGSRFATVTGLENAFGFAKQLSTSGLTITSGLALGIDTKAHQGALAGIAKTIAVVATGIDIVYPARNRALANKIIEQGGCIVTEFLPSTQPKPGHFPRRNRLISGLSLGVLVVEAAIKSGSLITARYAIEQNREVFAMPGSINSEQSKGCHHLIKEGAKLVDTAVDIIDELDFAVSENYLKINSEKSEKSTQQDLFLDPLLASVGYEVTPVDLVVSRSKLSIETVLTRLTILELRGLVSAVPGGYLRLK